MSFKKYDDKKVNYDLVPPKTLKYLAEVLTYGANKYDANNWKLCEDLSRYRAAALRHFEAYRAGEFLDQETGLPHLAHCLCNITFLLELENDSLTSSN